MTTVVHPSSDRQDPGPRRIIPRRLKKGLPEGKPTPWVIVAAWGPCGFSPWAPGTVGTAGAIPLFWLLRDLPLATYLLTTVAFIAISVYAAGVASRYWKIADASPIVIDEVAGYLVTMAFVPWSWPAAIMGFMLFRIFDIAKPWPASWFDRQKNPFGVVLDDVAAGVWAAFAFHFVTLALRLLAGCDGGSVSFWCAELTP